MLLSLRHSIAPSCPNRAHCSPLQSPAGPGAHSLISETWKLSPFSSSPVASTKLRYLPEREESAVLCGESGFRLRLSLPRALPHPPPVKTMCFYNSSLMTERLIQCLFERKRTHCSASVQWKVGSFGSDCCGLGL